MLTVDPKKRIEWSELFSLINNNKNEIFKNITNLKGSEKGS
jgi:hypothetical protein